MTGSVAAVAPLKSSPVLMGLSRSTLLGWYDDMLLIRRFEEKCAQLYGLGKIMGFCHLYNGQEAVSTGAIKGAINPDDYVITAYRDHGQAISKGVSPKAIMAELLGKHTGTTKGKGGSMHIFDRETNFLGGHAIVGGHIPIAAGAAFASKYRGEKRVCLCFMGDGATNIGSFHESLNLAALWKLPVIYIIENNRYGMGTAVDRSSAVEELNKILRKAVINNEIFPVYCGSALKNKGVQLVLDAVVDYLPSPMSDPIHGHYRSKEEVEEQKKYDPITVFGDILKAEEIAGDEYFDEAERRIKRIVEECVEFAESSPEPPVEDLYKDVYYESIGD